MLEKLADVLKAPVSLLTRTQGAETGAKAVVQVRRSATDGTQRTFLSREVGGSRE